MFHQLLSAQDEQVTSQALSPCLPRAKSPLPPSAKINISVLIVNRTLLLEFSFSIIIIIIIIIFIIIS